MVSAGHEEAIDKDWEGCKGFSRSAVIEVVVVGGGRQHNWVPFVDRVERGKVWILRWQYPSQGPRGDLLMDWSR